LHLSLHGAVEETFSDKFVHASLDYAATFWVQYVNNAKRNALVDDALTEQGQVGTFLRSNFLEWLECLNLLDKVLQAMQAFKTLADIADVSNTYTQFPGSLSDQRLT
jgi:hypothetical protein